MDADTQVTQLEQALIHQAESLAREHLKNAEAGRLRIRAEAEERLKLKQDREVLAAKGEAERMVRRRVQAAETRLAAELDRLRWALTETVRAAVDQALQELMTDRPRYLDTLGEFLAAAARELPEGDLVAEVGSADLEMLKTQWTEFAARNAPGRQVELAVLARPTLGGMRVRLADNRARLDQTFEARKERLADELARVVMERLFASTPDLGTLGHG